MHPFFNDMRRTILPGADARHGPLPLLLLGMTLVTGLVDAFSYLVLGHVFVANMTGNVVFLGFALAGAPGFSIGASLAALASFWLGALVGGAVGARLGLHRGRLLATTIMLQALLFAASVILTLLGGSPVGWGYRYALILVLAASMGMQNATARKLAVPDLTTTVLTLTITGAAADSTLAGGKGASAGRRAMSVFAMFVGALLGALLVVHSQTVLPLAVALAVLLAVGAFAHLLGRSAPTWVQP